jgi:hypothetical protein
LLNILRESGCAFLYGKKHDPSPESYIRRGSIIAPRDFAHPLLARDVTSKVLQQKVGVGSLSFIARGKKLSISQTPEPSGKGLNDLAYSTTRSAGRLQIRSFLDASQKRYGFPEVRIAGSPCGQPVCGSRRLMQRTTGVEPARGPAHRQFHCSPVPSSWHARGVCLGCSTGA